MINIVEQTPVDKTPIEVLLQVDDDGTVSAKNVYKFLELNPAVYSRWCRTKILNNGFAEEDIDFKPFNINVECGGQATTDYKLTIPFAKKLCMQQGNKRGEEARNYFIKVEETLKQVTIKEDLPVELQMVNRLMEFAKKQHKKIIEHDNRIKALEEQKPKEIIVEHTETKEDTYFSKINAYSSTSIGKAFNLSAVGLNGVLHKEGVLKKVKRYYVSTNKQGTTWIITDEYRKRGYSLQKYYGVKNVKEREPVEITYAWTPKGVAFIVELLKRNGFTQYHDIDNRTVARNNKKQS